jgi:hypothetical protein
MIMMMMKVMTMVSFVGCSIHILFAVIDDDNDDDGDTDNDAYDGDDGDCDDGELCGLQRSHSLCCD